MQVNLYNGSKMVAAVCSYYSDTITVICKAVARYDSHES